MSSVRRTRPGGPGDSEFPTASGSGLLAEPRTHQHSGRKHRTHSWSLLGRLSMCPKEPDTSPTSKVLQTPVQRRPCSISLGSRDSRSGSLLSSSPALAQAPDSCVSTNERVAYLLFMPLWDLRLEVKIQVQYPTNVPQEPKSPCSGF